ncbi:DEAD/DEAH box helicase [Clostridium folliculivorans]|uniref:DEAD/DEAH box helicase n=1 Tax=Clostridium folliculivorans TaxID=2886038 RepID=UPI0021C32CC8|nr:DEAD/DEAH box helicase [Clostridium folliculivorans]GKU30448.1 hypothetical protein CFB3_25550 [Clostridium folliculivorans]
MAVKPRFNKGDNVKIVNSGSIGTVNDILVRNDSYGYKVMVDGKVRAYQEKYLEPYIDEESEIMESLAFGEYGGSDDFELFQTWFRLKRPIEGNLYSFLGSKTIFNPYQFKPLLKFISAGSEERLFIADEVGVGKTIETGIILTELIARGRLDRHSPVLIVCPNVLGPKWVKEMEKRFNFRFHLHNGKTLENFLKMALNGSFQTEYSWSIASIQLLRNNKFLNMLHKLAASRMAPLWSMVIIDEAHHMRNVGTESNTLGRYLSFMTEMMVMLSATPLNLRDADFFNQMNILNPAMFPDMHTFSAMISPVKSLNRCRRLILEKTNTVYGELLHELEELERENIGRAITNHPAIKELKNTVAKGIKMSNGDIARYDRILNALSPLDNSFTRTLKREAVDHRVTREVIKIPINLTDEEMNFYNDVIEAVKEAYLVRGGNPAALGFITNMPMRMVSSCIPAMKDYLVWCVANDKILVSEDGEEDDDSQMFETSLSVELKDKFIRLINEAEALKSVDTKFEEFSRLVEQLTGSLDNPQILVFSFFIRTLKYLKEKLTAMGYKVGLISGEVPLVSDGNVEGRYEIMDKFEKGELDILLASEVGGEGLDFQFCQAMINYDMPYNPMRIEQRIGRLDRFGQKSDKVIVANMYLKDTIDEKIYTMLYDRIKIVEESVGLIEPIIGTKLVDLQNQIVEQKLSDEQIEQRTIEIEIAVAQAKLESERFENSRKELLGDEHFAGSMANLEKTDFVKPVDSVRLTKMHLSNIEDCSFEEIDEDRAVISLSKEVISKLQTYSRRPGSEGSLEELKPLIDKKKKIGVVFNGSLAIEYPSDCFLPPCGFWTRFILKELEKSNSIKKAFSMKCLSQQIGLPSGKYIVPLFEVCIDGFRTELNLSAVPVNMDTLVVHGCDFSEISRLLGRYASDMEQEIEVVEPETYIDYARNNLEQQMEVKMEQLKLEHAYKLQSRISTLQKGSEVRIDKLKEKIEDHCSRTFNEGKQPNGDFIRLTEAQITNDEIVTKERIDKLNDKKELVLTLSLVAISVLEVKG